MSLLKPAVHTAFAAAPVVAAPPVPATDGDSDDRDLVVRAVAGDHVAEALIYRRHAKALANLAARLTGSRADAEDIVQETFTAALEHLSELRDPAALRSWLTRIAVSHSQRRLRRRRQLRWLGLDRGGEDLGLDALASPDASPETRCELSRVAAVLAGAPEPERVAWTLHRVEGETLESAASLCGCSLATVKRRVAAVEARLAKRLNPPESAR